MDKFFKGNAHGVEYKARAVGFRRLLKLLHLPLFYQIEGSVKFNLCLKQLPSGIPNWTHVAVITIPDIIEEDVTTHLKIPTRYLYESIPFEKFEKPGYEIKLKLTEKEHQMRMEFSRINSENNNWDLISMEIPIADFKGVEEKVSRKEIFLAILNAVFALVVGFVVWSILFWL